MDAPLVELEGTWEEIREQMPDFDGRRLRVIVLSAPQVPAADTEARPIHDVLADLAAEIPPEELAKLPTDFVDQLDHYIYGTPKR